MTLKEAALQWAKAGFSVIPVNASEKKPLVRWRGYIDQRPGTALISLWWNRWPDANIGVVTGSISDLVVVDADLKKASVSDMDDFLREHPTDLVVETGSGGRHFYYRHPNTAVVNRVAKDDSKFDVRGDGGYVVVPPSSHASGREYTFLTGGMKSLRRKNRPVFKDDWIKKPTAVLNKREDHAPQEKWINDLLQGVTEGGRNDAATRLAGYFFSRGMAYDVVFTMLDDWNTKNKPAIEEKELHTIVKSVYQTHLRRGAKIKEPSYLKKNINRQSKLEPGQDPFAVVPLSSYMVEHGATTVTWCIEEWLPDKTIAMAVAPPGTYKTWATFDAAISIASGTPFMNRYPVLNPGPVVIIQQEDFHGQIAERLATILRARFDFGASGERNFTFNNPDEIPIHIHPDRRLRFGDDTVMDALEQKVADLRPRLVIIDPLYSTGDTDDYMASTVQAMFRIKELRDRYGCSFLLAHHTKKQAEGTAREGLWGSQFLNAFLETGWQFRRRDAEAEIVVRRHFKVSQNAPEEVVSFDIHTGVPVRYSPSVRSVSEKDKNKVGVIDVLQQVGPSTDQEIAKRTEKPIAEVRRLLGNLRKLNSVTYNPVSKRWEILLQGSTL